MLGIATLATLGRYARQFEERCMRYPKAWYLAVVADDRCRNEFWATERRRQERFHLDHPELSAFLPSLPWESVIKESTTNVEYWMRELQEPALALKDRSEVSPSWVKQHAAEEKGDKRTWEQANKGGAKGPRKKGRWFTANNQGIDLCRNYGNGRCQRGDECSWAHQCEICLGEHSRQDCADSGRKKGGGAKGKGKAYKKKGQGSQ